MIRNEILLQLDRIFLNKQSIAKDDYNKRFESAMTNKDFAETFTAKRKLDVQVATAQANNTNIEQLLMDRATISKKLLNIIETNNIDLNMYFSCPICKDTGYTNGKMCECKKKLLIEKLKEQANLPAGITFKFENNRFDELKVEQSFIMSKIYNTFSKWINNFELTPKYVMFLCGGVGVGKTSLAIASANSLLDLGYSVFFSTAFDMHEIFIDKRFGNGKKSDEYNKLLDSDLLIIDDLGTEPNTIVDQECLFSVIDSRINSGKKTIICTNLTLVNFAKRYGERSTSRLTNKRYSFAPMYITGDDLRK